MVTTNRISAGGGTNPGPPSSLGGAAGVGEWRGPGGIGGSGGKSPEPKDGAAAATHPLAPVLDQLGELRDYAGLYVTTQVDRVKVKGTQLAIYGALGVLGAGVGAAALGTATVCVLLGIAFLIGDALDRLWAGMLITGAAVMLIAVAGVIIGLKSFTNSSRKQLKEKYDRLHSEQRARWGHDAHERAQQ